MPAYKDSKTGTWFVKFYCKDWTGENKQIKKRGFATKREALDYERNYKIRQENNLDMTFGEFWKLYTEDVKNYVKLNTWLTKEHIVDTKILPYFKNLKMNEITPGDVRKWQNEMVAFRNENFKYLMKRLGYVFKKDAWMEVQAPGFRYYHKLAKMDEMFSEDMLRHHVDIYKR